MYDSLSSPLSFEIINSFFFIHKAHIIVLKLGNWFRSDTNYVQKIRKGGTRTALGAVDGFVRLWLRSIPGTTTLRVVDEIERLENHN